MRIHLVINPVAGRRAPATLLDDVTRLLEEGGAQVTRYETTGPGDASRHVAALDPAATDRLVSVGGDGTLREVVNARPPPLPWPVGVIPLGTANLIGRELGMPLGHVAESIASALLRAEPWTVALLEITRPGDAEAVPEYAVANVGIGLDAAIVHTIDEIRSSSAGSGGYARWIKPIWSTFRAYTFPKLAVTIDGQRTYRANSCVIQNASNYGGLFQLSPRAALDTPKLDVMLLRCQSTRDLFRVMFNAFRRRAATDRHVRIVRGQEVRLTTRDPASVQADGDAAGRTDLRVRVLPAAMQLLRVAPVPAPVA